MKKPNEIVWGNQLKTLTFDQLPETVMHMYNKLEQIENLLKQKREENVRPSDQLLIITQAADFLHLSLPTIYGLVSRRKIPFMKKGKRLYFSSKGLTEWLNDSRRGVIS